MELQKKSSKTEAISVLSQHELLSAIKANNFENAVSMMPKRIEQVFDQPKVNESILAIGANAVLSQVEYLLHQLALLVNVGGNLNDTQVQFIADQLIQRYPNESIADFKLCFDRALTNAYGQIFRLDCIVVFEWMQKYMEEKYAILEDKLMKEKDELYKPVVSESNVDWLEQWKQSVSKVEIKAIRPMTDKEIQEEGKEKPKGEKYMPDPRYAIEHANKITESRRKILRDRHPELTDEEIEQRVLNMPI